jgi:hypothetical protein
MKDEDGDINVVLLSANPSAKLASLQLPKEATGIAEMHFLNYPVDTVLVKAGYDSWYTTTLYHPYHYRYWKHCFASIYRFVMIPQENQVFY